MRLKTKAEYAANFHARGPKAKRPSYQGPVGKPVSEFPTYKPQRIPHMATKGYSEIVLRQLFKKPRVVLFVRKQEAVG